MFLSFSNHIDNTYATQFYYYLKNPCHITTVIIKCSSAVHFVLLALALVILTTKKGMLTSSVHLAVLPLAIVNSTKVIYDDASSMFFTLFLLPIIIITILIFYYFSTS